jgi:hypothetical protein
LDWCELTELGGDVYHLAFYHFLGWEEGFNPSLLAVGTDEFGGDGTCDLIEVVFDAVKTTDDIIPEGPGDRASGPPKTAVSSPAPKGLIETTEDVNLTFYAPANSYGMVDHNDKVYLDTWGCGVTNGDPNVDPNKFVQGPFEYSVYWGGTDPCSDNMTLIDPPGAWFPSPADVNSPQEVDGPLSGLAPATTYYWRVDVNDINTQNFRCGGTPVMTEGDVFSYTTWGKAILEEPEVGAEIDIEVNPDPNLVWYNDGYAASFELYLYVDADKDPETTGDRTLVASETTGDETAWPDDPNAWVWEVNVPLNISQLYVWRVDEVNTAGVGTGDDWYFSTLECEVLEDMEYATIGNMTAVWSASSAFVVQALGGEGYDGHESQKVTFARNSGSWPGKAMSSVHIQVRTSRAAAERH